MSQSRLYCTRWDGKEKGDAINDAEYTGNVLLLLNEAMNFVKSNTKRGWEKLPDGRKNKPEYAERAVSLEGYRDELKPVFKSTPTQFQTIIYANAEEEVGAKDVTKDVGKDVGKES